MNVIGEGSVRVGVLALQGDFALHARALARCGSASRDRSTGEASPSIIGVEAVGAVVLDGRGVPVTVVFIRAPRILRMGAGVEPLAEHRGETVMARQGSVVVATFHPELTDDTTVHRYFCDLVRRGQ